MRGQKSILVVDPEAESRESLSTALASRGYGIDVASTDQGAIARMRRQAYPVAVRWQSGESENGWEFVRRAREIRAATRVILCGGTRMSALGCLREQAFAFFRKPYSSQALLDMIERAFDTGDWREDIVIESAVDDWVSLSIRAKFSAGERVVTFLRALMVQLHPAGADELAGAIREILLNAIEHGSQADAGKRVRLSFIRTSRAILCSIQDPGNGFALEAIPHAAVSNPPEDQIRHVELREAQGLRPGGFGILMARNMVDDLVYNQKGNEVLLVKHRPRPRSIQNTEAGTGCPVDPIS
ncbi:MAG: ATP-binding protein [Bryobacterales bacterium]|nr:ATP-binding protein [Bryobacterales bacterium]